MGKKESSRKTLAIIDGKSVFYRGYYAMPNLALPDGTPTGGVYGFAVMALEIIKKIQPDYVVVAWDKPKTNIRSRLKLYPKYKANRKPPPPDFYEQIPLLERLLEAFGWPLYEADDYEADDIMGTVAIQAHKKDLDTMMVTSDLDMIQLVNHHTKVAALKKGLTNIRYYDEESFTEEYGLTPEQFIDVKALKGDSSDNIPGVAGVGEKTALQLIKEYGTLEKVYENLDEIKPNLRAKLEKDKDMALLSHKLVTIMLDAPVKFDPKEADIHKVDPVAVRDILDEYQFKSLIAQLPESWRQTKSNGKNPLSIKEAPKVIELDDKAAKDLIQQKPSRLLLMCENNDQLLLSDDVSKAYFCNIKDTDELKLVLEDKDSIKVGFDLKCVARRLLDRGIELKGIGHDVMIGAFLINPLERKQSLSDLTGSGNDLDPSQAVAAIWQLIDEQEATFGRMKSLAELAQTVEWPVISVIAKMEHSGIRLNSSYLEKMSDEFNDEIEDVEQEIYGHANMEFNISSPSQLSEVLFDKLGLPKQLVKKTKTGYSTAASELDKLRGLHPIINLITKYREYTKLKGTYIDALPKLVAEDGRLHTTFAMDVAATGRLSSHDPNLQNIPIRTEIGRRIRDAFVAERGNVLISADYSQFELRIAAALSGDMDMQKAFEDDADIHTITAARVHGVPIDKVTKNMRREAKAVNFGVMYGLGAHGLSQATGMSYQEAKEFIKRYFDVRADLLKYIEKVREQAKHDGYVETLYGRRRPTPDVHSSNFMVREAAMRQAVNMPFQGTAADIMKKAMILVDEKLNKDTRILLQIHDSLIVEAPHKKADAVGKRIKEIMEAAAPELKVKLKVDTSTGETWGDL